MPNYKVIRSLLLATVGAGALATSATATEFNIPQGDLRSALSAYATQTGTSLVYVISNVRGIQSSGAQGNLSSDAALERILKGTGFTIRRYPSGAIGIDREQHSSAEPEVELAQSYRWANRR